MDTYKNQFGHRFTYEKLAHACGIQKAYLSRVLNGHKHLSADQCFQACEFLNMGELETEYTMRTHELNTSSVQRRKKEAEKKIDQLRKERLKTHSFLAGDTDFGENAGWQYFGNANLQLVYLALTIPALAENPHRLCPFLGLSEAELQHALIRLQELRLITYSSAGYSVAPFKRHLTSDSPYIWNYHLTHRLKVCHKLQTRHDAGDYFFSALFSADDEAQAAIHLALLEVVAQTQSKVSSAKETAVFQLNMDLLKWV